MPARPALSEPGGGLDAAAPLWFQAVEIAHRLPGRVRLRLRPWPGRVADPAVLARALTRACAEIDGVADARVNPRAGALILRFDPECTDAGRLRAHIAALAPPEASAPGTTPAGGEPPGLGKALALVAGALLLPAPLRFVCAAVAAAPVLRQARGDVAQRTLTSHGLEAMAVSISLARGDTTAAATTSALLALGEHLEHAVARRSDDLLRTLLRPTADSVWVLRGGEEVRIPAVSVAVGDAVVAGAGSVIPVDGTVLDGEAMVNEATMTGESVSVVKARGATVLSGTLIEEGRLVIYAEQVGPRTASARIADYVQTALAAKSEAQLEASRLADRLVPGVLRLAGGALVLTGDWRRAASVLQADYSCALKLATPVAFKAAMFGAGRRGLLIKGAGALERLAQADTVLFDKTGTLTTGLLQVTDALAFDSAYSPDDLICLAASVEEHYFHPLAMAVVTAARSTNNHRHFDHAEVQFIVAHGVASEIDGQRVVVGSRHFVEEDEGIDLSAHRAEIEALYRAGKTLLFIGFGGRLLGLIALIDQVRPAAADTIARLRRLGVKRVLMLTGDHRDRAAELAAHLGIDGVHAELLPQDKARIIEDLGRQGARIAFVGDGINDAPALAGAHVGIAMQRGADIARLTADIALLEDAIERVADAKAIAQAVMARIRGTYRLTVGLNTAILAGAALGALSPVATALLHNGTTIGILLDALRPLSLTQGGRAMR